jgi:hypothetical protein
MRSNGIPVIWLCIVLLCAACSPGIDRNKFKNANRAARDVQRAIEEGAAYESFDELLQRLSAETTILQDKAKSTEEKELAKEYSALLAMYRDGLTLWRYRREFSGHNFVPKGLIYVGQDVEPIVTKYRLETESHVFGPTRQPWKSIPEDSIRIIWYNAGQQLKKIDTLLKDEG